MPFIVISSELKHFSTAPLQCVRAVFFLISWIHLFNLLIKVNQAALLTAVPPQKDKNVRVYGLSFKTPPFFHTPKRMNATHTHRHTGIKKNDPVFILKCFHLQMRPLLPGVIKPRHLEWFTHTRRGCSITASITLKAHGKTFIKAPITQSYCLCPDVKSRSATTEHQKSFPGVRNPCLHNTW